MAEQVPIHRHTAGPQDTVIIGDESAADLVAALLGSEAEQARATALLSALAG